ncbi:class III lanthionine synthetase LanKC [Streptomyces sp.]|uniref:class III lanthionine synthetase LanKC n=1 Tax=Streptomyces sp. TaxID=1931 RepID=UPI002F402F84
MQVEWETVLSYMTHHPRWFEDFGRRAPSSEHIREYRAAVPDTWTLGRRGYWMLATPPGVETVAQGWKLHVAATSQHSVEMLRLALPVLRDAGVHFKFLMDREAVQECNGKTAPRGASGKFITVYPADEAEFRKVGSALTEALAGFEGPYILSDRRYPGSRAVYYRYGGFATTSRLTSIGMKELLIRTPDGSEVVDIRHPYWHTPPWATDPFAPGTVAPSAGDTADALPPGLADGRFTVTSALSFSNRGGIYRGVDNETGADVILREARPGVEIGRDGIDAADLLRHEYDLLVALEDTGLFVRPVAFFTQWEHAFLVEEYVEGIHLGALSIAENPVYGLRLDPGRLADYYERFRGLWTQVAEAIAACHERGIVLCDLSPTNIMVTPDDRIRIIDLESAYFEGAAPGADSGAALFTPGMVTRRARVTGKGDRRNDYYGLGGIMLVSVMVCHQADILDPTVPRRLFAEVAADLDLPAELVSLIGDLYDEDVPAPEPADLLRRIEAIPFATAWRRPPPLALPARPDPAATADLHKRIGAVLDGVADHLVGAADPTRADRLFPADLLVFLTNPLSLAHGAYGSLYALHRLGREVPDPLLGWALRQPTDHASMPPGLYYGLAGVAWAQSALGLPDLAVRTLRSAGDHPLLDGEPGIVTGTAGFGMACLRLWADTGREEFLDRARAVGARLAATASRDAGLAHWALASGRRPVGYAEGAAGVALFLLELHRATGDQPMLELGRAALDFDLAQAQAQPGGPMSFPAQVPTDDEPVRVLRHYWDEGTAGVLTSALRYYRFSGDSGLREAVARLLPDVRRKHTVFPQLFHGTSGLGNALLDAYEILGDPELLGDAQRIASAVLCTAIERPEGIVFPGEQTVRESCDLASGSAGVALFLDRVRHARPGARTNFNFVLDDLPDGPGRTR